MPKARRIVGSGDENGESVTECCNIPSFYVLGFGAFSAVPPFHLSVIPAFRVAPPRFRSVRLFVRVLFGKVFHPNL